jgi:hypothetical protein
MTQRHAFLFSVKRKSKLKQSLHCQRRLCPGELDQLTPPTHDLQSHPIQRHIRLVRRLVSGIFYLARARTTRVDAVAADGW